MILTLYIHKSTIFVLKYCDSVGIHYYLQPHSDTLLDFPTLSGWLPRHWQLAHVAKL